MRRSACFVITVLMLFLQVAPPIRARLRGMQATPHYAVEELAPLPDYPNAGPHRLNNNQQILGSNGRFLEGQRACLWQGNAVALLAANLQRANSLNTVGKIVGEALTDEEQGYAAIWDGKRVLPLASIGTRHSDATGINDHGQICGNVEVEGKWSAFLWTAGKYRLLETLGGVSGNADDVNNKGDVVGWAYTGNEREMHACLWSGYQVQDLGTLPGLNNSSAHRINANGWIIGGGFYAQNLGQRACVWRQGKMEELGILPGYESSQAYDINADGWIVGCCDKYTPPPSRIIHYDRPEEGHTFRAFLYRNGKLLDLNTLLSPHSGWMLETAIGINDRGQIVGMGKYNAKSKPFLLSPVK